jgi:hypothetical protein
MLLLWRDRASAHRGTCLARVGSKLLRGKYGSDHFVHIRSTGTETTGLWKALVLKVTTKNVCDKCNNDWLNAFENDVVKPIASPLILGEPVDIVKPADQEKLAAWAYKMALLLEVAVPHKERAPEFFTAAERLDFRKTTFPNEHVGRRRRMRSAGRTSMS